MLVVRVDELVKDLRPPKAAALRAVLDKFINTNRKAVQAIKAAFCARWCLFYFGQRGGAYGAAMCQTLLTPSPVTSPGLVSLANS
jgi:hypothetical protein